LKPPSVYGCQDIGANRCDIPFTRYVHKRAAGPVMRNQGLSLNPKIGDASPKHGPAIVCPYLQESIATITSSSDFWFVADGIVDFLANRASQSPVDPFFQPSLINAEVEDNRLGESDRIQQIPQRLGL
jgi:hypothetical protein